MKTGHNIPIKDIDQKYKDWLSGKKKPKLFYPSRLDPGLYLLFFFFSLSLPGILLYLILHEETFHTDSLIVIAVSSIPSILFLRHYFKLKRLIPLIKSKKIILGIFVDSESILCRVDEHKCSIILAKDIEDISIVSRGENGHRMSDIHINENNPLLEISSVDFVFNKGIYDVQNELNKVLDYR